MPELWIIKLLDTVLYRDISEVGFGKTFAPVLRFGVFVYIKQVRELLLAPSASHFAVNAESPQPSKPALSPDRLSRVVEGCLAKRLIQTKCTGSRS